MSAALTEVAGHGLHMALFGAGLVAVAALLATRGGRRSRRERARLRELRTAARGGRLGAPGVAAQMRND
jgi:hypothetical protein